MIKLGQQMLLSKNPSLVFISNGITPYGTHFLERIAGELFDFKLHTIYSYEFSMGKWQITLKPILNAVVLGKDEYAIQHYNLSAIRHSYSRYLQLVKEIKTISPIAVIVLGYGNIAHYLLIEWCYKNDIACLILGDSNILGDCNSGLRSFIKSIIVKRVVSCCSAFLPCGTLGSQYFEKYGARPEQIFFSPVEPDYSLIEEISTDTVKSLTMQFKFDPDRYRLIYSGRLVAIKRLDLLIDAFAKIAEQRSEWDLLIVGGGSLEAELKMRIPDWLRHRVYWTGFVSSQEHMSALYQFADILVLPSDYEPWALVVNEAVCAGLALVCSDAVGAAFELLCDGENGRYFHAGDVESLIEALLDVTKAENLLKYKIASKQILSLWRKKADPVDGLRCALEYCFRT
ncbi:glycosyltransferase family 4 protein [Pelodictyon phaeoclathratiforme]|jgi:glycosyltransferase involved in cell wall biosynthesis|uniref:Glycosyl transferase group 1 n=1 Tax=Pelodictyon phaeoclathratiforme (strain DSM 5477 / BU-1) TaxID=324925 RepID=B4SDD1_PELPB|nr:glycosyltransferase family 4 protein [Pelodictyon phaeoclathratiforme]ACF42870.1 glycosyl transferase group 1 [Pelodictyon phaeoclathratiforme BU-1]MBV5329856.1 glycosyltransferase family 4 protein [Chlorobium sp.]